MANILSIESLFNFALIAGVVYGFIFNMVVFFAKRRKGLALTYVSLLVLFITLNNLQAWLIAKEITSSNLVIHSFRVPWYFLCTPMFYAFIVHYLKVQDKVRTYLVLSFVVFGGMCLTRLGLILNGLGTDLSHEQLDLTIANYSTYEEIFSFLYALFIFRKPFQIFRKNKKLLEFVMNYDDLVWIKHFLFFAILIFVIWIVTIAVNFNLEGFNDEKTNYILRLTTSVLIYWIGFKGLFRYRILEDRIVLRENINQDLLKGKSLLNLNLKSESADNSKRVKSEKQQKLFEKIDNFVKNQKKFLDPYLSLDGLADEMHISSGHLSFLINNYSQYNFSDYINSHRVTQAKAFILEDDYLNYTIVSIGLESGFNSKSTFYSAFKKFTGLSPTQFKNKFAA